MINGLNSLCVCVYISNKTRIIVIGYEFEKELKKALDELKVGEGNVELM